MRSSVALITGVAGFAGAHLAEELLTAGYKVWGAYFGGDSPQRIKQLPKKVNPVRMDILNRTETARFIKKIKPDYIFHLAGFSSVGLSFEKERETYRVNIEGSLNVFEAAGQLKSLKKLVFTSSSEVYGTFRPIDKTLKENDPINPISPYGNSKAAAEAAALMYWRRVGLPVVISRAFNHSGPGQSENFVIPAFASQIAVIEAGRKPAVIKVGDLTAKRDLSDVRDIVRGYRLLAERGKLGQVYLLCSGQTVSIKTMLNKLLKLSSQRIRIEIDKSRLRKNDIPALRGDNRKAIKELGFSVRYPLEKTLEDCLDYFRKRM